MAPKRKAQGDNSIQQRKCRSPRQPPTKPYVYGTLLPDEIRILVLSPGREHDPLRATLETVSIHDEIVYKAISYAWGDPVFPHTLQLPQGQLHITESLFGALKRFRSETEPVRLWADAVCINQGGIQEKNHQVAVMDQIYERAEEVLVWLGEAQSDDCLAWRMLNSLADAPDVHVSRKFSTESVNSSVHALNELFDLPPFAFRCLQCGSNSEYSPQAALESMLSFWRLPWFSRLWVIQEAHAASSYTVLYGTHSLTGERLEQASGRWGTFCSLVYQPSHQSINRNGINIQPNDNWAKIVRRFFEDSPLHPPQLLDAIIETMQNFTSDAHDRVYAIRRITGIQQIDNFIPDYGLSLADLWKRVAVFEFTAPLTPRDYQFRASQLTILALAGVQKRMEVSGGLSWVPDFEHFTEGCKKKHIEHRLQSHMSWAGGKAEVQVLVKEAVDSLQIRGKFAGSVAKLSSGTRFQPLLHNGTVCELHESYWLEVQDKLFPWYANCLEFWLAHASAPVQEERSMKVLLEHGGHPDEKSTPSFGEFAKNLYSWKSANLTQHCNIDPFAMYRDLNDFLNYMNSASKFLDTTSVLAATTTGHVGWVPESSTPGDLVTLFEGSPFPFILRERPDGYHSIVGDACIQGIMHGELWPDGGEGVDWIEIK